MVRAKLMNSFSINYMYSKYSTVVGKNRKQHPERVFSAAWTENNVNLITCQVK